MSTNIQDILDMLPRAEKAAMMYAFNANISRFAQYAPGRYIGVHTDAVPSFLCETKIGYWRLGTLAPPTPWPPPRKARVRKPKPTVAGEGPEIRSISAPRMRSKPK